MPMSGGRRCVNNSRIVEPPPPPSLLSECLASNFFLLLVLSHSGGDVEKYRSIAVLSSLNSSDPKSISNQAKDPVEIQLSVLRYCIVQYVLHTSHASMCFGQSEGHGSWPPSLTNIYTIRGTASLHLYLRRSFRAPSTFSDRDQRLASTLTY